MSSDEWNQIPCWMKFTDDWPNENCEASNVGELKQLLARLPDNLKVNCGLGKFVTLVVEGTQRDCWLNFHNCD